MDSKDVATLQSNIGTSNTNIVITQNDSLSVASIYKAKLDNSQDDRFKTWKDSDFSVPVTIYNFDGSIYGYMYGVVDENGKLVGYIVAGACAEAPPVLEYSLYPDRFVRFSNEEKLYFGSETGYVFAKNGKLYSAYDNAELTASTPDTLTEMRSREELLEIKEQWLSILQDTSERATQETVSTYSTGTQYRLPIDSSDYAWYNVCSYTSMAMYFDALGRRIERGFLEPGRPHSLKINDYLHDTYGHIPSFDECADILLDYANDKKVTSNLTFTKQYVSAIGSGGSTNSAVFNKHKQIIQAELPTLVGYSETDAHLMMGIGYTSDNFYIVRDTWCYDGIPMRDYYYNQSGYKFCVMGLTYTNSSSSTAWGTQVLRPGDSNFNVKRLKYMLKALYYEPGSTTLLFANIYDSTTEAAVKAFQSDCGLTADGIVGANTYLSLKKAHIMKYDGYTASWRVLNVGKSGDDVAQLQIRLYELGYNITTADGIFGSTTKAAVMAFQQDNGLTADGIVGNATFTKLYTMIHNDPRCFKYCEPCNE